MSTTTLSTSAARAHLGELCLRVRYGSERITLTRHGRPIAVLISPEDLARLERITATEDHRK